MRRFYLDRLVQPNRKLAGALSLLLAVIFIIALAVPALAYPAMPFQFYGNVTINGSAAPAGITVTAKIGDVQFATGITDSQGRYGYSPNFFRIPADDPSTTSVKEGGVNTDTIQMFVAGASVTTIPAMTFTSGGLTNQNLTVTHDAPIVNSADASNPAATTYTLNGNLILLGGGSSVNVSFEYGTTTGYGLNTTPQALTAAGAFTANLIALIPNSTYHFRAKADGGTHGTANGDDLTFTTPASQSGGGGGGGGGGSSAGSTTYLVSSANPSVFGQSITFTATVAPNTTTGSVQFKIDGVNFGSPVAVTTGKSTSGSINSLAIGQFTIAAVYSGDSTYSSSTGMITQTVNQASSVTSVTSSANPTDQGKSVTLTATVNAASPAMGVPTGKVTFNDGETALGTSDLKNGLATYAASALTSGNHSIKAAYSGDVNFNISSGTFTQVINQPPAGQVAAVQQLLAPSTNNVNPLSGNVDSNGVFSKNVTVSSDDGNASVNIGAGTQGQDSKGTALSSITITQVSSPPDPPDNADLIGQVYEMSPNQTTFSQAVTVSLRYDPSQGSSASNKIKLVLAWYDTDNSQWVPLESAVNNFNRTVSAKVDHFTKFGILSQAKAAAFIVSDLSITPANVESGKPVTISVLVTNTGDTAGSITLNLKINKNINDARSVTVAPGSTQTVTFKETLNTTGNYTVAISGLTGTFAVNTAPPAVSWSLVSILIIPLVVKGAVVLVITRRKEPIIQKN